ncbi:hypothetical protein ACKWTF_000976 [Chironomus riparius]
MKVFGIICVLTTLVGMNYAQRGSYAGSRPIVNGIKGPFPEENNELANRFSDSGTQQNVISLPQNFPIYVPHNMYLIDQVNQRPLNEQPFWFANRDIINEHLKGPGEGFSQEQPQIGSQNRFQNGLQSGSQFAQQARPQNGFQGRPQVGQQNIGAQPGNGQSNVGGFQNGQQNTVGSQDGRPSIGGSVHANRGSYMGRRR